jgi:hypothetical protein
MAIALWGAWAILDAARAEEPFPRPAELRPAVDFWKQVFAAYGTHQGIMHDREDLNLIYGVENLGRRDQQRVRTKILERYRQALARLAEGEIDTVGMNTEEWRVWQAHHRSRDSQRYRQALEKVRLQVGQRDRFAEGLKMWDFYGETMRRIFREQGLPDSLALLPFVESAFNAQARSTAGAVGLWQITRPAALRLLRVDGRMDERRDPLKATAAAARILKANYQALGAWPLAITAYNHGLSGVARGVRQTGSPDIAHLVRHYRSETFGFASRNFYAEFLAALEVIARRQIYYGDSAEIASAPSAAAAGGIPPLARLEPNFPNPFNKATRIDYSLRETRFVQLDIFDVRGRIIRSLVNGVQGPGEHRVEWDGRDEQGRPAATGVYFASLRAGSFRKIRKMTLLR